jgi:hypothetical protein
MYPFEGGSPRITDVDLVNYSNRTVTFNAGDAVDINIQRSLGNIGNFYEGNVLLPLQLSGSNPVIDLNEQHEEVAAPQDVNVQQMLGKLGEFIDDDADLPFELANGNNQIFNLDEEYYNYNDDDEEE